MSSTTIKDQEAQSQGNAAHPPQQGTQGVPAKEPEKKTEKTMKFELLVALMVTDWLHGDRHFAAQIQENMVRLLKELSGGDEVKDPNAEQLIAREAAGRLEGLPTGIRPAPDQPAMRQDEQRLPPPTKAA
jgi:hypothetical protein